MLKTDENLKANCKYNIKNTLEHISYKTVVFNIQINEYFTQ